MKNTNKFFESFEHNLNIIESNNSLQKFDYQIEILKYDTFYTIEIQSKSGRSIAFDSKFMQLQNVQMIHTMNDIFTIFCR